MKIQLKKFPNGARIVYEQKSWTKCASKLKDHFCLIDDEKKICLYLHRDTYVEPMESTYQI